MVWLMRSFLRGRAVTYKGDCSDEVPVQRVAAPRANATTGRRPVPPIQTFCRTARPVPSVVGAWIGTVRCERDGRVNACAL